MFLCHRIEVEISYIRLVAQAEIKKIEESKLSEDLKEYAVEIVDFFTFISKATKPKNSLVCKTKQEFPVASYAAVSTFLQKYTEYLDEMKALAGGKEGKELIEACTALSEPNAVVEVLSEGDFFKMCTIFGKILQNANLKVVWLVMPSCNYTLKPFNKQKSCQKSLIVLQST